MPAYKHNATSKKRMAARRKITGKASTPAKKMTRGTAAPNPNARAVERASVNARFKRTASPSLKSKIASKKASSKTQSSTSRARARMATRLKIQ